MSLWALQEDEHAENASDMKAHGQCLNGGEDFQPNSTIMKRNPQIRSDGIDEY